MDRIEEYGIYDLRNYARMLGVKSPTTKNRGELLDKIQELKEAGVKRIIGKNKGRPPKSVALKLNDGMPVKKINENIINSIREEIYIIQTHLSNICEKIKKI